MAQTNVTEPAEFDELGFLADPSLWSRDLGLGIAAEVGIAELSEDHWRIIDRLREEFFATRGRPAVHTLCRTLKLGASCLHELFGGPLAAWKIAGLPNPDEEIRANMARTPSAAAWPTAGPPGVRLPPRAGRHRINPRRG